ncbi:MAG: asparagine synthase-related protein [Peptococcaceae bacterium]|jgi:asparagine synthase (glutamine-hydrolysing)|nr:asparagine synthase-related protein [Peptococcaceae bacterium]
MSAVCGIYQYNGSSIPPQTGSTMMKELRVFEADAEGTWQKGQLFLGWRAQHITPESVREILPYHDEASGLTITADAIIDNRGELFDKLAVQHCHRADLADSMLILRAYQKWGGRCPEHLLGDFAFAIWDERGQELFCAVDPAGRRTFYYHRSAGLFAFCTLLKPLFVPAKIVKRYDETWLADFLAMPCVSHQLDPELTIYEDIYLLPAGHNLTVRSGGMVKQAYWRPQGEPKIRLKSDQEYESAFREVLREAVRCRLRSIRPAAAMMSGGLDSTSLACMAAKEAAKAGGRFPAFTALPMEGYRDWLPDDTLADESSYVEAVREQAGNIDVTYCRCEGRHPLSGTGRLFAVLEQPYKIFENLYWVDAIMAAAGRLGVGAMLSGTYGNDTISFGYIVPHLRYLFRTGRWHRLVPESWHFIKEERHPFRELLLLLMTLLPYNIQKNIFQHMDPGRLRSALALSPINPEFACRISVAKRFDGFEYDPLFISHLDPLETRLKRLGLAAFSHTGPITVKLGLAHKMSYRDPTVDRRVIDFCLRIPEGQYVRAGQERSLLRRAMTGILPDKVRLNTGERGRQSADWAQRLEASWPELAAEIRSIGDLEAEREYLDIARIHRFVDRVDITKDHAASNPNLRMLVRSLILSRFLRSDLNAAQ